MPGSMPGSRWKIYPEPRRRLRISGEPALRMASCSFRGSTRDPEPSSRLRIESVRMTYIHGTGEDEQRRLSLMNDVLLNPAMLRELNLRGDEQIADFGSGLGQFSRAMARAVPQGR